MNAKKLLSLLVPVLALSPLTHAESDYEKWKQKTRSDFQAYLDENDKAFIQFLKQKWKPVDVKPAEQRDPAPKPPERPTAPVISKPVPQPPTPVVTLKPVPQPDTAVKPQPQTPVKPVPEQPVSGPVARFDFYGSSISVPYPAALKKTFSGHLSNDTIAAYWLKLASSEHKDTVKRLKAQAQQLGLNDWGTALLFDRFARTLHRDNNSRILTSWFLLVKAGYDARVAYNDRVHLLLTSGQELFGVTYFRLGGKQYYAVNLNDKPLKPGKVFTYEGQHEEGAAPLDFSEPNRFAPGGDEEQRKLAFSYGGKDYHLNVAYPQRYVSYFASYPQLSLPNYFRAGLPAVTAQSLLTQLRPVVQGQSELEAVNRLLRFVQTAFAYETDDDQFHEENYLFPLETLHYPYSDCEDRAALFAWLTESLLGLEVVILDYPGHVATAVAFDGQVQGDSWTVGGKRFVIADPTYVNAGAGMTMPQYAGVKPKIETF